ncbi:MAG TPA: hypothetical protein VMX17_10765 [Candidatus Glassbacteria bacterium]|nr:hypothetical protein [Candidatus Glassbacteria bacterium]
MNVIEFYNAVLELFPAEKLMVKAFVDPTLNNEAFPGIQFIYPNGAFYPPLRSDADTLMFCTPLEGPFYRLPVVGAIIINKYGKWWWLQVVVKMPDGKLIRSYSIHIKEKKAKIKKEIGLLCSNNWYSLESAVPVLIEN